MDIKVGTYLRVETISAQTGRPDKETPFGTCIWQITELGLDCPEIWRKKDSSGKELPADKIPKDGVKCVMIGGSGPSARAGFTVIDSLPSIAKDIDDGITTIVSEDDASRMEKALRRAVSSVDGNPATGCLEIN